MKANNNSTSVTVIKTIGKLCALQSAIGWPILKVVYTPVSQFHPNSTRHVSTWINSSSKK